MVDLPSSMRVAAIAADGGLRIEERAVPRPAHGELLLELRCCGLCGTDLHKINNRLAAPGTVLGHELVGTVVEVGDGLERFRHGDRVVVPHHVACGECALCLRGTETRCDVFQENLFEPGGFSEYLVVRSRAVERAARLVPEGIEDDAASFLEPAACVLRGVDKAEFPSVDGCAVVLGAGSMGLLHLQVLRAFCPHIDVVVSDPLPERRDLAQSLGAAASCDPERLGEVALDASMGVGVDAVFDTVGGSGPLEEAVAATRLGGTVVLFAHAAEGEPAGFELNPFFKGERRLVATYSGSLDEQQRIADCLFDGRLDPLPLVSHRLPLSRISDGVAMARERTALKIMLEPDEE
jgi:L-iditol 2-dehydrogenase